MHEKRTIKIDEQTKENIKFNELPFSQAVKLDKRNIISSFISVIVEKLELVNLIFGGHKNKNKNESTHSRKRSKRTSSFDDY